MGRRNCMYACSSKWLVNKLYVVFSLLIQTITFIFFSLSLDLWLLREYILKFYRLTVLVPEVGQIRQENTLSTRM